MIILIKIIMISEKNLYIVAIMIASIGLITTTQTNIFAQDAPETNVSPDTEEMAVVLSLEDTRNGATYQYIVNSTAQMKELIKSVYKMGLPPSGIEATALMTDPTISAIDGIITEDSPDAASLGEDVDVAGWGWLKKTFKTVTGVVGKGIEIGKKYGPIAAKFAPLLL